MESSIKEIKQIKQIKYVMYPDNFMRNNPDIDARQAEIYCQQCKTWQPLNIENYKTLPFGCDNHSKQRYYYPNGQCCRTECKKTIEEAQYWKKYEERFFIEEAYLQTRCDLADAKGKKN